MQLDDSRVLLSPTDLANHLARAHLAALEIALVCGERQRPLRENPQAELIRRKGDEHELAYLARLKVDAGGRAFQPSRLERLSHLGRRSVTRARGRRTGPSCRAAGRDSSWISVADGLAGITRALVERRETVSVAGDEHPATSQPPDGVRPAGSLG
jgi:hypothetical protein